MIEYCLINDLQRIIINLRLEVFPHVVYAPEYKYFDYC